MNQIATAQTYSEEADIDRLLQEFGIVLPAVTEPDEDPENTNKQSEFTLLLDGGEPEIPKEWLIPCLVDRTDE